MALFLPRRWTRQPQYPVGIDGGHPIAANMVLAVNPAVGLRNLAGHGVESSSPSIVPAVMATESGISHVCVSSSASTLSGLVVNHMGPMSGVVICRWLPSCLGVYAYGVRNTGGFCFFPEGAETGITLKFTYYGVTSYTSTVPFVGELYKKAIFGFSITPSATSGLVFYANGEQLGNPVNTGAPVALESARNFGLFQRGDSAGLLDKSTIEGVFLWERHISSAEHAELAINPWQIFRPQSARIYSFSTGAAPSSTVPPLYHQRQQQGMAS